MSNTNQTNGINQILGLLFALCVGMVLGSLDWFRDRLPWHRPPVDPQVVYITPAPAPNVPQATPAPGAWMRDRGRTTQLDRPSYFR